MECDSLTALVGRNGSGKSSLLRAIEIFFVPNPKFDDHDFYAEQISQRIEIEVTFTALRSEEETRFARYIQDGSLTVIRALSLVEGKPSATYHGLKLSNPDFAPIRSTSKAADSKRLYDELRKDERYNDLAQATTVSGRLETLTAWEDAHPDSCSRMEDEGQFFGFKEVGQGYLGKFIKFIPIPAVRDASAEAEEGKGSAITELIDLVVRSSLLTRKDLQELKDSANLRYSEIINPSKLTEMTQLEGDLTSTLKSFVPDASVHLTWLSSGGVDIRMPKADVTLTEDGYRSSVTRTGHGLQRAFILTMLQHLAVTTAPNIPTPVSLDLLPVAEASAADAQMDSQETPDVILSIEEPELYQHPTRQRHLAAVLFRLAAGESALKDVTRKTQIMYSTHCPAFVGLDRFDQIRLFRKQVTADGRPKVTKITNVQLEDVANQLWEYQGRPGKQFTAKTLSARLRSLMTPWMNEGFFADLVVLVEGEEDRAAILGTAYSMGYDLDSVGISVIPCDGKTNLDRPALIFDLLGIPVYLIWDSDYQGDNSHVACNRCLLRIVHALEEDYPDVVAHDYACFKTKLGDVMRKELGQEPYDQLCARLRTELGFQERHTEIKNPFFIRALIEAARESGKTCATLEKAVAMIVEKRHGVSIATARPPAS